MKQLTPAIILYIISGLTFTISSLLGYELIIFVSKPIIASSIIFHYLNELKNSVNFWHLLFLLLFFLAGILNLFEDKQALLYVIVINMLCYTILLRLVVKEMFEINFRRIDSLNVIYFVLTIVFVVTLVYVCLGLVFTNKNAMYPYLILYAIIITSLTLSCTVLYTLKHSNAMVFLLLAAFCYLICDLFYIIYYYYYNFIFFRLLSIMSYIVSYYFIVTYFIKSNNTIDVNLINDENF